MRHLWAILLILAAAPTVLFGTSVTTVAQPSESQPQAGEGPPPGGCTPIGVTASGEVVFPLTCWDFIEKHKAADRESRAAETKPTTGDASKTPAAAAPSATPGADHASKAPATVDARKPSAAVEAGREPAALEASKPPAAESSLPAASAAGAPAGPDGKNTSPAAARAPAEDAAATATRHAAGNAAAEPATTAALPKRNRTQNRVAGPPGCVKFRSYDAASATSRDYSGQRRPCP